MKKNSIFSIVAGAALLLSSMPLFAQQANPKTNAKVMAPMQSVAVSNSNKVETYTSKGITVTTLLNEYQFPYGVSPDGTKVAIQSFSDEGASYYWEAPDNLTNVEGVIFDVSNDGKVCGYYTNTDGIEVAGYWQNGTWTFLGMHPDYPTFDYGMTDYNSVWCMNEEGTIMAGMQWTAAWTVFPFIWSEAEGYTNLPVATEGGNARTNSMNNDGSVVGGWAANENGFWMPTLWINGELNVLSEDADGEVNAVSPNGNFAAGYINGDVPNAFIWSQATGIQIIENTITSGMDASASATCVSDNGEVFGYVNNSFPPFADSRVAFAKTADGAMTTFNEYAIARGWTEAANWSFYSINDMTSDGNCFIGAGVNPNGEAVSFMVSFGSTSIEENTLETNVYPNPTTNTLNIEIDAENAQVSLIDLQGRVVMESSINGNSSLSLDNVSNGFYFLQIKANGKQSVSKIQIQK